MRKCKSQEVALLSKNRQGYGDGVRKRLPTGHHINRFSWFAALGTLVAGTVSTMPLSCVSWGGYRLFQSKLTASVGNSPQDQKNGDSAMGFSAVGTGIRGKIGTRFARKCKKCQVKKLTAPQRLPAVAPPRGSNPGRRVESDAQGEITPKMTASGVERRGEQKRAPAVAQRPYAVSLSLDEEYTLPVLTSGNINTELETFTDRMVTCSFVVLALTRVAETRCGRLPEFVRLSAALDKYFQALKSSAWAKEGKMNNAGHTLGADVSAANAEVRRKKAAISARPTSHATEGYNKRGENNTLNAITEAIFTPVKHSLVECLNELQADSVNQLRIKGSCGKQPGPLLDALRTLSRFPYKNKIQEFSAKSAALLWYLLNQIEALPSMLTASKHWTTVLSKLSRSQARRFRHPIVWFMRNVQETVRDSRQHFLPVMMNEAAEHKTVADMLEKYRIYWDINLLLGTTFKKTIMASNNEMLSTSPFCSAPGPSKDISCHSALDTTMLTRIPHMSQSSSRCGSASASLDASGSSVRSSFSGCERDSTLELETNMRMPCLGNPEKKSKRGASVTKNLFWNGPRIKKRKKKEPLSAPSQKNEQDTITSATSNFFSVLDTMQHAKSTDSGNLFSPGINLSRPTGSQESSTGSIYCSPNDAIINKNNPLASATCVRRHRKNYGKAFLVVADKFRRKISRRRQPLSKGRKRSAFLFSPVSQPSPDIAELSVSSYATPDTPRISNTSEDILGGVNFFTRMLSPLPNSPPPESLELVSPGKHQSAGIPVGLEATKSPQETLKTAASASTSWTNRKIAMDPRALVPLLDTLSVGEPKTSNAPHGLSSDFENSSARFLKAPVSALQASPATSVVAQNTDVEDERASNVSSPDPLLTSLGVWLSIGKKVKKKGTAKSRRVTPGALPSFLYKTPPPSVPEKITSMKSQLSPSTRPCSSTSSRSAAPSITKFTPPPSLTSSEWAIVNEGTTDGPVLFGIPLESQGTSKNATVGGHSPQSSLFSESSLTASDASSMTEDTAGLLSTSQSGGTGPAPGKAGVVCGTVKMREAARRACAAGSSLISVVQAAKKLDVFDSPIAEPTLGKLLALAYRFIPAFHLGKESSSPIRDFSEWIEIDADKVKTEIVLKYITQPVEDKCSLTNVVAKRLEAEVDNLQRVFDDIFGDPAACTCNGRVIRQCWPPPRREYCSICRIYMKQKSKLYQLAATISRLILKECAR